MVFTWRVRCFIDENYIPQWTLALFWKISTTFISFLFFL
jgi:hypothetical protein